MGGQRLAHQTLGRCQRARRLPVGFGHGQQFAALKYPGLQLQYRHQADVLLPLSANSERAARGIFTRPFYESHYAVIARKDWRPEIRGLADLAPYRVGVLKGVASESLLKTVMASDRLVVIDDVTSEALFQALRDGRIDVAVFSKAVFEEKRYQHEYFDLAVVHTLHDAPRVYGFYFHASPRNQQIVQAFDRYLAVLDVSGAVAEHEDGERQFIQRYVIQRSWHLVVLTAGAGALVLVVVLAALLYRYRRLARLLAASNEHILQQQQALQAVNQDLERQSQTDGLTGLANRRQFDHALLREHARQQRTGAPLSLSVSGSWRRDACQRGTENDGIFRAKRRRAKPPDLLTDRTIM